MYFMVSNLMVAGQFVLLASTFCVLCSCNSGHGVTTRDSNTIKRVIIERNN